MSLADCIRKAGKALNQRDATAISTLADEIEATGVDRVEAEKQAVEQHITKVQTEIDDIAPMRLAQELPAYKDAELVYNDLKNQFLELMPEDADTDEVMDALGEFSPTQQRFLKALNRADWLGFDYPSQAISTLLSGSEDLSTYDLSVGLKQAMGVMVNRALGFPDQLAQDGEMQRGMIEILQNEHIIALSNASDMSTFLHESAHMFMSMEGHFSKEFGVSENQQAILDHVGAESFDTLSVEQHETLAESFEVYLREGIAPSTKLADAFAVFRSWLLRVYESVRLLPRQKLDDDLRAAFDRLLATEEEIQQVAASPAYQELFRSKEQAGMTDAQWAKYIQDKEKRDSRALTSVEEKLVKQLKARKTKEWKAERKILAEEEIERLQEVPVYRVLADTLKRTDETLERPLDRESVQVLLDVKNVTGKWIRRTSKDGSDPDLFAEAHGFADAKTMLKEMDSAPSIADAAVEAAEARMIEKYGDVLNDGSIEAEVIAAMHNEKQADLLLKEINSISRQPKIDRGVLKAEAKRVIGTMKNSEIRPSKFYRNEMKAAQRAVTAKTEAEQLQAKQQQLANHYLYREALKVKDDLVKWRKHIDYVRTHEYSTNQVDVAHIQTMKLMANMYRSREQNTRENLDKALAFYDGQAAAMNEFVQIMDPQLTMYVYAKEKVRQAQVEGGDIASAQADLDNFKFKLYEDLTVDELRGAYNTLRNLRFAGGRLMDANLEFKQELHDLTKSVADNGGKDVESFDAPAKTKGIRDGVKEYAGMLPSIRNMVRDLDGHQKDDQGQAFESIYMLIEDANNEKLKLHRELYERYEDLMKDIDAVSVNKFGYETIAKENGGSFKLHSEGRMMLALYWGTESSREAIREGHGVTDNDVMRMMQTMSPSELELVNAVWELNESMWPAVSSAHVERYGVAPMKLEPTPFIVNGVKMTGGHQQLFYDSMTAELADSEKAKKGEFQSLTASKAGSMIERVGSGGRKVYLDKANITRAIEDVIHFTAFANPSRKLSAMVNNKEFKNTVIRKHGEPFFNSFIHTLRNISNNKHDRESYASVAQGIKLLRRAATFKYLFYSVRNVVQQFTVLPLAMEQVGVAGYMKASAHFLDPAEFNNRVEFVNQHSEFMKNRASLVNREAAEHLRQIAVGGKVEQAWKWITDHGFTAQTAIDSLFAYPIWQASFDKAYAEHGDTRKAVSAADTAVAETVGSGSDLHLGGGFQSTNNELIKGLTQFGTWFNAYYQRTYRASKGYEDLKSPKAFWHSDNKSAVAMSLLIQPLLLGVMAAAVTMDFPDEDETWAAWATEKTGGHLAGMFPIIRDIYSAFVGFKNSGILHGATGAPSGVIKEIEQFVEGKQTPMKTGSDVLKGVSAVVPVPGAGQVTRVLDFIDSDSQGKEHSDWKYYQMFVEGPDRNK